MLSDEVKDFIGKSVGTSVFVVEKEPIRRFADSVGEENPLYYDEEYAKKSKYGSIIAPPGFVSAPWLSGRATPWGAKEPPAAFMRGGLRTVLEKCGFNSPGGVDAGIEYEFSAPVRAGDTITANQVIKDIIEREGRTGNMAFIITEITYTNQNGEVVCKSRSTGIQR